MMSAAKITIQVPREFRSNGSGTATLSVSAATVGDALLELERQFPGLHRGVCDETGRVRRHINLFVNSTHIHERQGLETLLKCGDVITILPAVSGG